MEFLPIQMLYGQTWQWKWKKVREKRYFWIFVSNNKESSQQQGKYLMPPNCKSLSYSPAVHHCAQHRLDEKHAEHDQLMIAA
mmetsp:Transcript_27117/g.40782  ORF Transcript_27117/g.40782 Transcript_27117/m.40782 type:complete len:82 (+) Transcript_27117:171-416(+)